MIRIGDILEMNDVVEGSAVDGENPVPRKEPGSAIGAVLLELKEDEIIVPYAVAGRVDEILDPEYVENGDQYSPGHKDTPKKPDHKIPP